MRLKKAAPPHSCFMFSPFSTIKKFCCFSHDEGCGSETSAVYKCYQSIHPSHPHRLLTLLQLSEPAVPSGQTGHRSQHNTLEYVVSVHQLPLIIEIDKRRSHVKHLQHSLLIFCITDAYWLNFRQIKAAFAFKL